MRPEKYDFSGWVTKNDIQCSDGRTILKDAFAPQDGTYVPMVWAHDHDNPQNVLGKIYLENRDEGVYGYGIFNNSERALAGKEAVNQGNIDSLSIWANHLTQDNARNVSHGRIREVSLVLAGANPGAKIDFLLAHGDEDEDETQAVIYGPEKTIELWHEDNNQNDKKEEEPVATEEKLEHAEKNEDGDMTLREAFEKVMDKLDEDDQNVVYAVLGIAADAGAAAQSDEDNDENIKHEDNGGNEMKTNAFDQANGSVNNDVLTHDDEVKIFEKAKQFGSLREAVMRADEYLEHSVTDTITIPQHDEHILYPDPKAAPGMPVTLDRRQEWVKVVMNGVNKVPYARVKMFGFDITADEARAKGYITGNKKVEEVITAFKRSTDPTTVYKLQGLDRDVLLDMDFDIVRYLRSEMEGKLDEELARAFLFGDGRSNLSNDKINENNIRPIWTDNEMFTVVSRLEYDESDTPNTKLDKFITACVKSRKQYRGSGTPIAFMSEDLLADLLLMKDGIGHKLYPNKQELANALLVSQVVSVPVMDGLKRTVNEVDYDLKAIIVNLSDYTVGNNKGGEKTMFEDFDIDYNKQKYLIETRKSGALTVPYSAIVIEAPSEEEEVGGEG